MTTIGLIGSGHIGGSLARLAVAAGYDVVVSNSRGPETLTDLVAELGPKARAATAAEAAAAADLAVVSIPLKNYAQVPVAELTGKVVIDTNNYYPQRDGMFDRLEDESTTTAELLQEHLPTSKVVKAFNNIGSAQLLAQAGPRGAIDRQVLLIAGNDAAAKQQAAEFIESIGYGVFDAGPLAEGWRFQRDTPAYSLYANPVSADLLRTKLAEARRYRDLK